jgi:membrane associated rhomboid family serine protease
MGIYDRDYYRDTGSPQLGMRAWSVTTWLLVINLGVFFADALMSPRRPQTPEEGARLLQRVQKYGRAGLMSPLKRIGHFSMETAVEQGQVWRFVTFQFLHADLMHLAGNMISLFMFGSLVEAHFGPRRYLAFYLLCGIAGAATYLLMAWTGVLNFPPWAPMVGASAGIFGVLVAGAYIAPDREVYSMIGFIPLPMKMRHFAILLMVVAAVTVLREGPNAGGQAAHLGGGVLGLLFMLNQQWLNPFAKSRAGKRKVVLRDWSKEWDR